jgi:molybdopterin molybdotransferase
MPEFLKLVSPDEALEILFQSIDPIIQCETIQSTAALGRVTCKEILSPQDLPEFRRSTVDGYAVLAKDTHGASESLPAYLKIIGEVLMGTSPDFGLFGKDCSIIHTGGMLPKRADAVIMLEDSQLLESGDLEIYKSVAVGENVIEVGEDIKAGEEVIPNGKKLRPSEIGGLMALGITEVSVAKKPIFGILSSGDEVIPPDQKTNPGQVRDINSYTLSSLIEILGGEPVHYGIISDSHDEMLAVMQRALRECDHIIVTAGSSASSRDLTAEIMNKMGKPGVLVHGVNIKPGKPTIFGVCGGQVMIGLPGNPVSALVIAMILVAPIIDSFLGLVHDLPKPSLQAKLTVNVASQAGREDWVPVRLSESKDGRYLAEPVFGRSNLIFILSRSHGIVKIPAPTTGIEAGTQVEVRLI